MAKRSGIVRELYLFLRSNKNYWIAPILVVMLLLVLVVLLGALGGGAVAPFIYALF